MSRVTIRIPDALRRRLEAMAAERQTDVSALIRQAVEAYVTDEEHRAQGLIEECACNVLPYLDPQVRGMVEALMTQRGLAALQALHAASHQWAALMPQRAKQPARPI